MTTLPYVAAVSEDELLEALRALLVSADARAPEWSVVDRFVRQRMHDRDRELRDEARQLTLLTIARSLPQLRAEDASSVAGWAFSVWRSRIVDVRRARAAHRSRSFGSVDSAELAAPELLDAEVALAASEVARAAIAWTFAQVDAHLDMRGATPRSKRRVQARTALFVLVLGLDREDLERELGVPMPRSRVHAWTRRGRPHVLSALARWQAAEPGDERIEAIAAVLGELMRDGRADEGQPRSRGRKAA